MPTHKSFKNIRLIVGLTLSFIIGVGLTIYGDNLNKILQIPPRNNTVNITLPTK